MNHRRIVFAGVPLLLKCRFEKLNVDIRFYVPFSLILLGQILFTMKCHGEPISEDEFVRVEGGCYQRGDQFGDGLPDELPVRTVCLSDFYLSKYEVTQEQWLRVMDSNPSKDQAHPRYPVDVVSWHEVEDFINALNTKTDGKFRLPTEAEWEYACRAGGKKVRYGTADGSSSAHLLLHSGSEPAPKGVLPVGSLPANELGLHDMSGNVSEWVLDWYDRGFYAKAPVHDPRLIEDRTKRSRVRRGGYWGDKEWVMRCTFRNLRKPNYRLVGLGFRLARDP
ncbi:MAG: formylglycine-generating enzyme family protein [Desulfofustis sp.]|nr:formylglycine-generating enzyme family protein [Desulfofustis sp.]